MRRKLVSVWVTHIFSTEVYIRTQEWQGVETEWIKSMTDLVLVKRDMLQYVQNVRMGRTRAGITGVLEFQKRIIMVKEW